MSNMLFYLQSVHMLCVCVCWHVLVCVCVVACTSGISRYFLFLYFQLITHANLFVDEGGEGEEDEPSLSMCYSGILLILCTLIVAGLVDLEPLSLLTFWTRRKDGTPNQPKLLYSWRCLLLQFGFALLVHWRVRLEFHWTAYKPKHLNAFFSRGVSV